MNAGLIKLWNDLQSSYYFIPGLMAIGAVLLALVTTQIDQRLDPELVNSLGIFHSNKADGARAILTTIAGSMMTVASVTFSITMVAVTSAAGQYGPRLIGNFMRDRANQFTLGTFTSTFIYCILILRIARTGDSADVENAVTEFVPNISLLVAMVLTLFSVGVMIFFIHHIPETLNVGKITGRVGRQLRTDIEKMFPSTLGHSDKDEDDEFDLSDFDRDDAIKIDAKTEGYIQAVNEDALLKWADENDAVIRLQYRPGDFITRGDVLIQVRGEGLHSGEDDLKGKLRASYAMGQERTAHQNILFLADELVEILARALSPGVNDPYTAMNCINWFHSSIKTLMQGNIPSPYRKGESGKVRIITYPISFERFVDTICDNSRSYIATDRNAALKMLTVLTELAAQSPNDNYKDYLNLKRQQLTEAALQSLRSDADRSDIKALDAKSGNAIADSEYYESERASQSSIGGRG
ncbi:DUF2254 domain-containing protein [Robiginitomaculum antarcticum]|uniref:DUF2254 domain-containing protein n=1 Tax=Robiginitomaculum antarcticum TaxID=437507 RepID=UPI00036224B3|nr:DUF2254 domain-containing protein [Robiginitomaculum antarcticum]